MSALLIHELPPYALPIRPLPSPLPYPSPPPPTHPPPPHAPLLAHVLRIYTPTGTPAACATERHGERISADREP